MYEWNGRMHRRGDGGSNIRALQTTLTDLGYDTGIDGDFGPKTEKAVKEFQKEEGLGADGIVGAKTVAAINARVAAKLAEQARKDEAFKSIPAATVGAAQAPGTAAAEAAAKAAKDAQAAKAAAEKKAAEQAAAAADAAKATAQTASTAQGGGFLKNIFDKKK